MSEVTTTGLRPAKFMNLPRYIKKYSASKIRQRKSTLTPFLLFEQKLILLFFEAASSASDSVVHKVKIAAQKVSPAIFMMDRWFSRACRYYVKMKFLKPFWKRKIYMLIKLK